MRSFFPKKDWCDNVGSLSTLVTDSNCLLGLSAFLLRPDAVISMDPNKGDPMLLIREVFHCKPGKVKPMIEKSLAMARLSEKSGMGKMKILTDFAGGQYW